MANKPNKMGRIEAEPKPKFAWGKFFKLAGIVITVVVLLSSGVLGTLGYQKYVDDIKAQGVSEYKVAECSKYTFEDNSATWLECEPTKMENNQ